jgi:hypothetical protein
MIHSYLEDNWIRVQIMHSIAKREYDLTAGTESREYFTKPITDIVGFCPTTHDIMRRESCVVGMVMAWSVVALESLINHAIAETLGDHDKAVIAIRHPIEMTKGKGLNYARSDLSRKLFILSDGNEPAEVMQLANQLSFDRNDIVHDKPFRMVTTEDCDVSVNYFRMDGDEPRGQSFRFTGLAGFYENCDQIKKYVMENAGQDMTHVAGFNFCDLMNFPIGPIQ